MLAALLRHTKETALLVLKTPQWLATGLAELLIDLVGIMCLFISSAEVCSCSMVLFSEPLSASNS